MYTYICVSLDYFSRVRGVRQRQANGRNEAAMKRTSDMRARLDVDFGEHQNQRQESAMTDAFSAQRVTHHVSIAALRDFYLLARAMTLLWKPEI